jgi:hypothetical protein
VLGRSSAGWRGRTGGSSRGVELSLRLRVAVGLSLRFTFALCLVALVLSFGISLAVIFS